MAEPQDSTAPAADASPNYKGRQAKRANSRQRQREILEATLRLIAQDGIRAVRHRAIAKEANVPLAATTYYFKDINDLISDAFRLFSEQNNQRNSWLQENSLKLLESSLNDGEQSPEALREELLPRLVDLVIEHIQIQVADDFSRRVEHAFLNESLHSPSIEESFKQPRANIIKAIANFLERIGIEDPNPDAHALHGIIQWLEYLLVVDNSEANWQLARASLERQLQRLFAAAV